VDAVRESSDDGPACFAVDGGEGQRVGRDALYCLVYRVGELDAESGSLVLVPLTGRLDFLVGLWPKGRLAGHFPSRSLRRTSSQGIADSGFARCSAQRRSSSAFCSGLNSSSDSRSWSERLSQRAIASSARSSAGSFSRFARLLDGMVQSSHAACGETRRG